MQTIWRRPRIWFYRNTMLVLMRTLDLNGVLKSAFQPHPSACRKRKNDPLAHWRNGHCDIPVKLVTADVITNQFMLLKLHLTAETSAVLLLYIELLMFHICRCFHSISHRILWVCGLNLSPSRAAHQRTILYIYNLKLNFRVDLF